MGCRQVWTPEEKSGKVHLLSGAELHFFRSVQATSDPTEFNLYSETAHLYIRIRLITRFRDYNAYIYYYDKAAAGEEQ